MSARFLALKPASLLAVAAFGLVVPNGLFLHWLTTDFTTVQALAQQPLALAFILDATMATLFLTVTFAIRPIGPVRWPWFLACSLLGGLGFGLPIYHWLNARANRVGGRQRAA